MWSHVPIAQADFLTKVQGEDSMPRPPNDRTGDIKRAIARLSRSSPGGGRQAIGRSTQCFTKMGVDDVIPPKTLMRLGYKYHVTSRHPIWPNGSLGGDVARDLVGLTVMQDMRYSGEVECHGPSAGNPRCRIGVAPGGILPGGS